MGISRNLTRVSKLVKPPLSVLGKGTRNCSEARGKKIPSSRVEGEFLWFFSTCGRKLEVPLSCNGDLREPLMFPWGC